MIWHADLCYYTIVVVIIYIYVYVSISGECSEREHKCKLEDRCIPSHLTCDNMDNCGDWSDEKTSTCGLSKYDEMQ